MRLSFANGEHADYVLDGGTIELGNADGNTLVLHGAGVAPRHARVTVDARGTVLEVLDPAARTHVNARPVREKALLRTGDLLCLGRIAITLKPDHDDVIVTTVPADPPGETAAPGSGRVVLRGVSGAHFGKTIAVDGRLVVGRAASCGLVIDDAQAGQQHAAIENGGDAIWLRDLGSPAGTAVNGVRVRDAVIHPGDQLAFERCLFVVEAPGLPLRGQAAAADAHAITEPFDAIAHAGSGRNGGHRGMWWLVGVAALLAVCLGLLFHRGF
jgi:pSer/pThr/pTyr-binding forkhead associated (FHA) protein